MKVAFITPWDKKCGVADYSRELVDELRKLASVEVFKLDDGLDLNYRLSMIESINQAHVVHLQHEYALWGSFTNPLQSLFHKFTTGVVKPLVTTYHGFDETGRTYARWGLWGEYRHRYHLKKPDRIIFHTRYLKKAVGQKYPWAAEKIRVVPIGIPQINPLPEAKLRTILGKHRLEAEKYLVVAGFINPDKCYKLLFEALSLLPNEIKLVVAGGVQDQSNRAYFESLKKLVFELGLADRVVFTGFLPKEELIGLIQGSLCVSFVRKYLVASHSFGQALNLGKAVLASPLPFFQELPANKPLVLLLDSLNKDELARKIRLLLTDVSFRRELERAARSFASTRSWDKIALRTFKIYQELMG